MYAAGKVCIIPRGTSTFCDKATMCKNAGGVAAIIYNNVAGAFLGTLDPATCSAAGMSIPSFSLAQELASQFTDGLTITGTLTAKYLYEAWSG